jgi:hypothetical protein
MSFSASLYLMEARAAAEMSEDSAAMVAAMVAQEEMAATAEPPAVQVLSLCAGIHFPSL